MQDLPTWGPASDDDRYTGIELLVSQDMDNYAAVGNDPLNVFQTGASVVIRQVQYHSGRPIAFLVEKDGKFKMFPAEMVLSSLEASTDSGMDKETYAKIVDASETLGLAIKCVFEAMATLNSVGQDEQESALKLIFRELQHIRSEIAESLPHHTSDEEIDDASSTEPKS